jgi:hypothetical protein
LINFGLRTAARARFFFQASALQFNAQHNVDFNTWIKDGIPYMSREDRMDQPGGFVSDQAGLRKWVFMDDFE